MNKIVIVGTSGCGKTTLGHKLSTRIGTELIDLDDLFWLPNWTPRSDKDFYALIQKEISSDKWIISGNYSRARQQIWTQADLIIWLDLPLFTCLWRGFKRSLRRWIKQKPSCNGNYETLGRLLGKNSILLWIWNSYPRRKRAYSDFFANHCSRQQLLRLKSKKEVHNFVENLFPHQ